MPCHVQNFSFGSIKTCNKQKVQTLSLTVILIAITWSEKQTAGMSFGYALYLVLWFWIDNYNTVFVELTKSNPIAQLIERFFW